MVGGQGFLFEAYDVVEYCKISTFLIQIVSGIVIE